MRQFKLYTYDETKFFSLYGGSILVTDVSGLGTTLSLTKGEGAERYYISDVKPEFEDIKFTIYFGVNGNTYDDYHNLMAFIASNGKNKLVLEYSIDDKKRYCDIWLKSAPKTQKDDTSTMHVDFLFSRLSYWYTKIQIAFSLQTEFREVTFPLDIPIPFVGTMAMQDIKLNNTFYEEYMTDIVVSGPLNHDLTLTLENANGQEIQRVVIQKTLQEEDMFKISGEEKKVTYYDGKQILTSNAYNNIDHNYDTFITIPTGMHVLRAGLEAGDTAQIIVSYKELVLD